MTILDKIITNKKKEVADRKEKSPIRLLEKSEFFSSPVFSLKKYLLNDDIGIIAEYKRKSPSKGIINDKSRAEDVTKGYVSAGASALSILTDTEFFGGTNQDLIAARKINQCPILRKDFVIDEYQIIEAKSIGADVILLIAACLVPAEVKRLTALAKNLGLEVLLELHAEEELGHICDGIELIGINNRDLKTFEVDIERSLRMAKQIPADKIKVAESGISDAEIIKRFKKAGFKGFLIGETFMKEEYPGKALEKFVKKIKQY